jgi:hypothetical protein
VTRPPEPLTGACLCGGVRYRCDAHPLSAVICHCDDCQRASGSAFSVNVVVKRDRLELSGDSLSSYETAAEETGDRRHRFFCSRCGSPIFTAAAELPDLAVLKAGTLDDRSWLDPDAEFFGASAQPWFLRREPRGRFARGAPIPAMFMHLLRRRAQRLVASRS